MAEAKYITRPTQYASGGDFCRIFNEEINGLYLLSFLLTGDREQAEKCFVAGLEDSVDGNPVFKEWARSWARRMIMQNAVHTLKPRPSVKTGASNVVAIGGHNNNNARPAEPVEIAAVLALEPFERFVYVMSVLERYSDQDCSVLLGCPRRDILAARAAALQQMGSSRELHDGQLLTVSQKQDLNDRCTSALGSLLALNLATSA